MASVDGAGNRPGRAGSPAAISGEDDHNRDPSDGSTFTYLWDSRLALCGLTDRLGRFEQ